MTGRWARRRVRESGLSVRVVSGKTTDCLRATHSDRPLSLTRLMARCLNKRLDSIYFHYTLLDVCSNFLFVYGNNQCMICTKNILLSLNLWWGSHRLYEADGPDGPVSRVSLPDPLSGPSSFSQNPTVGDSCDLSWKPIFSDKHITLHYSSQNNLLKSVTL